MEKVATKEYWEGQFETEASVNSMMEMYLKRNKLWDSDEWDEVVGARHHYREGEWRSEYDEFDGDFIVCYITTLHKGVIEKVFLFSDFLKWQQGRFETK